MFWKIVISLVLFGSGFLSGMMAQQHDQSSRVSRFEKEEIVLTVPKNQEQMNRQLIYYSASIAMLEEVQRQMERKRR
jgi:hypothetical protein